MQTNPIHGNAAIGIALIRTVLQYMEISTTILKGNHTLGSKLFVNRLQKSVASGRGENVDPHPIPKIFSVLIIIAISSQCLQKCIIVTYYHTGNGSGEKSLFQQTVLTLA